MPYYEWEDELTGEREDRHYEGPDITTDCGSCHGPDECEDDLSCRRDDCASCGYRVAIGAVPASNTRAGSTPPAGMPRPRYYSTPPWGRRGHRDNPDLEFHGTGPMYYGMEFEITCDEYAPMYLAEELAGGLAWTKPDGSVRGMELVTHPMTYDFAMSEFPWQMFAELKDAGCTIIPSTNGIHVHAARDGYGDKYTSSAAHQYRFMKFWYRNAADIKRMARRNSNRWAGFGETVREGQYAHARILKNPVLGSGRRGETSPARRAVDLEYRARSEAMDLWWRNLPERDNAAYTEQDRRYQDLATWHNRETARLERVLLRDTVRGARYQAVNGSNAHTLEMRVFASTLDPVTAQSTIGLVASTVEYTRSLTSRDVIKGDGWTWAAYRAWLKDQPLYGAVRYADKKLTRVRALDHIPAR